MSKLEGKKNLVVIIQKAFSTDMYGFKIIPQESFAVKLCPFITEYSGTAEGQNILWITLVTNWARAQSPVVPSSLLFTLFSPYLIN